MLQNNPSGVEGPKFSDEKLQKVQEIVARYPEGKQKSALIPVLHLAQEELAQLLGASRQRVNQELKAMEREEVIRIEPGGLVVRNREALMRIVEDDS